MKPASTAQSALDKLLSIRDLAAFLGVSDKFIYSRTGPRCPDPIPHFKLGKLLRFRLSDVQVWLNDRSETS
jgi:predicted DNA-binding transcriptional regulator AlpA